MENKGKTKDLFPGGNTFRGFHSFYDNIIPDNEANRVFCIKGGPGVGKSSFMKSIADRFIKMGYDVELHHCSSDNGSLDGVVIKQAKVAVLDGTSPHVVDPKNPGAVDEILYFGNYWNTEGLVSKRDSILRLNNEIKVLFKSCYHFLLCAKSIHDDTDMFAQHATDKKIYINMVLELKSKLTEKAAQTGESGRDRHLFHSALTPDGRVDYIDTLIDDSFETYLIKGVYSKGASDILRMLTEDFMLRGYSTEIYHHPLNPERIETIIIEKLKVALTTDINIKGKTHTEVDLDQALIPERMPDDGLMQGNSKMMETFLGEAYSRIKAAKLKHDEMEGYYIPQMDFNAVAELENQIVDRIRAYL